MNHVFDGPSRGLVVDLVTSAKATLAGSSSGSLRRCLSQISLVIVFLHGSTSLLA